MIRLPQLVLSAQTGAVAFMAVFSTCKMGMSVI